MRLVTAFIFTVLVLVAFSRDESKLTNEVWIDGSSFYKSIPHKKESTIYFEKWDSYIKQFLKDEDYFVALQLNADFDPLPADGIALPSLTTLAAISNNAVQSEYLSFLERFGRTFGINYMILPDTSGLPFLEKKMLAKVHEHSPFYFLHGSMLSREVPESKKEFENLDRDHPVIWLTRQNHNLKKLRRWGSKTIELKDMLFIEGLRYSRELELCQLTIFR